ncbi:hypothetical protein D3C79_937430 [compost metagenome]
MKFRIVMSITMIVASAWVAPPTMPSAQMVTEFMSQYLRVAYDRVTAAGDFATCPGVRRI